MVVIAAALLGVVLLYPSSLAQTPYYVREAELHGMSRLPAFIRPLSYEIYLHPNLPSQTVEGQERILISLEKPTSRIAMHTHGINITGLNLHAGASLMTGQLHTQHDKNLAYFT